MHYASLKTCKILGISLAQALTLPEDLSTSVYLHFNRLSQTLQVKLSSKALAYPHPDFHLLYNSTRLQIS
jgi:hypothetical protein